MKEKTAENARLEVNRSFKSRAGIRFVSSGRTLICHWGLFHRTKDEPPTAKDLIILLGAAETLLSHTGHSMVHPRKIRRLDRDEKKNHNGKNPKSRAPAGILRPRQEKWHAAPVFLKAAADRDAQGVFALIEGAG